MSIGSLFSGIGGLELGLEWAGLGPTLWQVEQDPFCRQVLGKHWPDATRYDDVRTFDPTTAEPVRILCGGFPCQDLSYAGKGEGLDGSRSGLWFEYLRIVLAIRPSVVVVENVPGLVRRGLDVVVGGLRGAGYQVEGAIIGADDVGAPHRRRRLFLIAYASRHAGRAELQNRHVANTTSLRPRNRHNHDVAREETPQKSGGPPPQVQSAACHDCGTGKGFRSGKARRPTQSGVGGGPDGLSSRLDLTRWPARRGIQQHAWEPSRTVVSRSVQGHHKRVRTLGNAVCPQVAYVVGMRVRQMLGL